MSLLAPYALKGIEWGSIEDSDDDDADAVVAEQKQVSADVEVEVDEFARPKTRNTRRKGTKERRQTQKKTKLYVFSDVWTWTETPFQLQAIVYSEVEMERLLTRFKWSHAYSPDQQMIWNYSKGKRSLHLPTPAYLARVDNLVV
jgi:hypothetical protein